MRDRFTQAAAAVEMSPYGPNVRESFDTPRGTVGRTPTELAPIVTIGADRSIAINGRSVGSLSDPTYEWFRAQWATNVRNHALLHPNDPALRLVYLVPHASAPTRDLDRLLDEIDPGVEVLFTVHDDPPPYPSPIRPDSPERVVQMIRRFESETDYGERGRLLGAAMTNAYGDCVAIDPVSAHVRSLDAFEKGPYLLAHLPDAIASCRCGSVDIETVEAMLLAVMEPTSPPTRVLPIDRTRLADDVSRSATMAELARVLEAEFLASQSTP